MSDDIEVAGPEGENQRPEWLPENFNSPEDLAKSYQEAQRKITELGQANRGLEESINTLSSQFEEFTAAQNRPDPQSVYSQWEDQYNNDPFGTMLNLVNAIQQQNQSAQQPAQAGVNPDIVAFAADQSMGQHHDDWDTYRQKVSEELASNPLFQRDDLWENLGLATQATEYAYNLVKAQDVLEGNSTLAQQAADTRAMKLNAQSAAGASGRTPAIPDAQAEWDAVKAAKPKNYWE